MEPTLTVAIIVAIITGCLGPISVLWVKRALDKKDKAEEKKKEAEEKEKEAWRKEVRTLASPVLAEINNLKTAQAQFKEELGEIRSEVDTMRNILMEDKEATILNMRITMKTLRDKYLEQGYAETSDKAAWNELYHRYGQMGGNHFREYVDCWKEDVRLLPTEAGQNKN